MDESTLKQWAAQALAEKPYHDPRFPPSPYYRFLKIAAMNLKPKLSTELGVSGGGGSFHLAIGHPAGIVVGVDIANDHPENISYIMERCHNFRFWLGDSIGMAEKIYREYGPVDLLFVDTTHTFEQTQAELAAYRPYLSSQAVICLDDLFRPEMLGFWESLPEPKLRLDTLHDGAELGGGFGVLFSS